MPVWVLQIPLFCILIQNLGNHVITLDQLSLSTHHMGFAFITSRHLELLPAFIIAHDLVMENFSYLRDIWNQLDFFIVWALIADIY